MALYFLPWGGKLVFHTKVKLQPYLMSFYQSLKHLELLKWLSGKKGNLKKKKYHTLTWPHVHLLKVSSSIQTQSGTWSITWKGKRLYLEAYKTKNKWKTLKINKHSWTHFLVLKNSCLLLTWWGVVESTSFSVLFVSLLLIRKIGLENRTGDISSWF